MLVTKKKSHVLVLILENECFLLPTCELSEGQEVRGGPGGPVVELVQQNLLVSIKEVRAEAGDGRCWPPDVVPENSGAEKIERKV